ncbi:ABC transporter substrate-binding protein [Carnobacterium gallinarum]|uniref:ABC transporter substrate-binding protein n=1 Tax=Carnobacterium gallinarum TaxID=2749 RepID=UPI00054FC786|nr:ABC transporter substrate-binding protein [Carnobacterium gallinarum]
MIKTVKRLSILLGVSAILLGACGKADVAVKESSSAKDASTEEKAKPQKTPEAIKGKEITVYSAGPDKLATSLKEDFEAKTGVKVNLFQGTTGKILSKVAAEKNNPVADVLVLASLSAMDGLKSAGELQPYEDAVGKEKLQKEWSDKENNYFGYSASALGITYNTKNVTTPPADWADLKDSQWKDRFNMPDPTLSGSALDFLYGFTTVEKTGWDTIKSWKDNGLQAVGANKESLNSVITGEKDIAAAGVDYMAYSAKAKGEPIDIVYPKSGTVVSPRAVGITKSAKEVGAAQAFVDYLLSDDAQNLVTKAYLLPGNSEIPVKDRAELKDIPQLKVDWTNSEKEQAKVLEQFTTTFGS